MKDGSEHQIKYGINNYPIVLMSRDKSYISHKPKASFNSQSRDLSKLPSWVTELKKTRNHQPFQSSSNCWTEPKEAAKEILNIKMKFPNNEKMSQWLKFESMSGTVSKYNQWLNKYKKFPKLSMRSNSSVINNKDENGSNCLMSQGNKRREVQFESPWGLKDNSNNNNNKSNNNNNKSNNNNNNNKSNNNNNNNNIRLKNYIKGINLAEASKDNNNNNNNNNKIQIVVKQNHRNHTDILSELSTNTNEINTTVILKKDKIIKWINPVKPSFVPKKTNNSLINNANILLPNTFLRAEEKKKTLKTIVKTPKTVSQVDKSREQNKEKYKNVIIKHMNSRIKSSTDDKLVSNPYNAISISLCNTFKSLFTSHNAISTNTILLFSKPEPKTLLFNETEIRYLTVKYFDCYSEFANEVIFDTTNKTEKPNCWIGNFEKKLQKTIDTNIHLINLIDKEKDSNNYTYIDKLITSDQICKSGHYLKTQLKQAKSSSIKKRHSQSRRFSALLNNSDKKDNFETKYVMKRHNKYAYNLAWNKVNNFQCYKNKENWYRKIQDTPFALKVKTIITSMKKLSVYYEEWMSYIWSNNSKRFIKVFNDNVQEIDIEFKENEIGNTFLNLAVQSNDLEICEYLIQQGANVNTQNNYGNTPLHYAYSGKYYEIVDWWIKNNAIENVVNKYGEIPMECFEAEKDEGM